MKETTRLTTAEQIAFVMQRHEQAARQWRTVVRTEHVTSEGGSGHSRSHAVTFHYNNGSSEHFPPHRV